MSHPQVHIRRPTVTDPQFLVYAATQHELRMLRTKDSPGAMAVANAWANGDWHRFRGVVRRFQPEATCAASS